MAKEHLEDPLEVVYGLNAEAERMGASWRIIIEPDGVRKVSVEEFELWKTRNSN